MSYSVRAMGRGRLLWVPSTYPTRVVQRGRDPDLLVRSEISKKTYLPFPSPFIYHDTDVDPVVRKSSQPNTSRSADVTGSLAFAPPNISFITGRVTYI